jgi:hypothetical protein
MRAPDLARVLGAAIAALIACTPGSCVPARASQERSSAAEPPATVIEPSACGVDGTIDEAFR